MFSSRLLSGIDGCPVSVVFLWGFFSNFRANSVLKCDTLARISGGFLGRKGFCLRVNFWHAFPENAPNGPFLAENRQKIFFQDSSFTKNLKPALRVTKQKPVSIEGWHQTILCNKSKGNTHIYIYVCVYVGIYADESVYRTRFGDLELTKGRVFVVFWPQCSTKKQLSCPSIGFFPQESCPNNGLNKGTRHDPKWTTKRVPLFNPSFLRHKPLIFQQPFFSETTILTMFFWPRSFLCLHSPLQISRTPASR